MRYASPLSSVPPAIDPCSLLRFSSFVPLADPPLAVEVDDSDGVDSGCEIPGVADEVAGVLDGVVEGGGCEGAAFDVVGTVATPLFQIDLDCAKIARRQDWQSMID